MTNIVFTPGNFFSGTQWSVFVGKSAYEVESVNLYITPTYWHVTFQVKGKSGVADGSFFHFFFFTDGAIKGVALPVTFCTPEIACTFTGTIQDGIKSHPPYMPQLAGKPGFSDDVCIEQRH